MDNHTHNPKLGELYTLLKNNGGNVGENVDEFAQHMKDANKRQQVYHLITKHGAQVGDFDQFSHTIGYGKPLVLRPEKSEADKWMNRATPPANQSVVRPILSPEYETHTDTAGKRIFTPKPTLVPSEDRPALPKRVVQDHFTGLTHDWDAPETQALVAEHTQHKNDYGNRPQPAPTEPEPVDGLWEGIKQGADSMWQGTKFVVGKAANLFADSSEDALIGMSQLSSYQAQGKDPFAEAKASVERYHAKLSELQRATLGTPGYVTELSKEEEQQYRKDKAIMDALRQSGGDQYKAIDLLHQKSQDKTWGDEVRLDAARELSKHRPTEGWGWVGELIPQMAGSAVAIGAAAITRNPQVGMAIGSAATGAQMLSAMGSSMAEAHRAGATDVQEWKTGLVDGAIEMVSEQIPLGRYVGRLGGKMASDVTSRLAREASAQGAQPLVTEMNRLLQRGGRELGRKLPNGKTAKELVQDIITEAGSEFAAEFLQSYSPIIYKHKDEMPTLYEALQNGLEGAKAGLLMGGVSGALSHGVRHVQEDRRRRAQGGVTLAEIPGADGQAESRVVEVLGIAPDDRSSIMVQTPEGDVEQVGMDQVSLSGHFTYDEWQRGTWSYKQQQATEELAPITHQDQGRVILARRSGHDTPQAIISGHVSRHADGSIDRGTSSQSIVVFNEQEGKNEMISIDELEAIEGEFSPEEWAAAQSNPQPSEVAPGTPSEGMPEHPTDAIQDISPEASQDYHMDGYYDLDLPNGQRIRGQFIQVNEDGQIEIFSETPVQMGNGRTAQIIALAPEAFQSGVRGYYPPIQEDEDAAHEAEAQPSTAPTTEAEPEPAVVEPESGAPHTDATALHDSTAEAAPTESPFIGRSMTRDEASTFVAHMEAHAEPARELDLTIENWDAEFGENGEVETPIGMVKMGDNQFAKMTRASRDSKLGMVKPTLTNPDVIIEDHREAEEGISERPTSYVFVKSFVRKNGARHYFFASVTVSKDGREVVISSEERRANRISKLLNSGKVAWINDNASSYPYTRVEESVPLNDSNRSTDTDNQSAWHGIHSPVVSDDKGNEVSPSSTIPRDEYGEPMYESVDADTAWDGLVELSDGDVDVASEVASLMIEQKRSELEQLKQRPKTTPTGTPNQIAEAIKARKAEMAKAEADLAHWETIAGVHQSRIEASAQTEAVDGGTDMDTRVASSDQTVNTEATEEQKKAGNYRKGHLRLDGLAITIEQPKGSVRSGVDGDGNAWSTTMNHTYGYIRGTKGKDGDHIDIFLSDNLENWNGDVYIVDQVDSHGAFDEHKVMYGFNSLEEAKSAYLSNYSDDWQGLGNITAVSKDEFKKWLRSSKKKTKPFSEYKIASRVTNRAESGEATEVDVIQPIGRGAFGNIYDQFRGKPKEAIAFLLERQEGEALGALSHPEVGEISLVWGNQKAGLQKIARKHPEVLDDMQDILDGLEIVEESDNRIKLENATHFAVVSKEYRGTPREHWLLTAYEKKEASTPANSSMDVDSTLEGKLDDTATQQKSDASESKGSEKVRELHMSATNTTKTEDTTKASRLATDAVLEALSGAGIEVVRATEAEVEVVLGGGRANAELSRGQKRALDTASPAMQGHLTVVSSTPGAKVLKDLDSAIAEYENKSSNPRTFIGDLARALGASRHGSLSQYATFETMGGKVVTIRLSNHNAKVSNFDNAGEDHGISIVITGKPNNGLTDDGRAHIQEYFYQEQTLKRAEGKPLVEILKGIKQALYSGEYKDTTGLAEYQEVNGQRPELHMVWHGSPHLFDRFDHSYMGSGEGVQGFGWGTYVTEVEGIARGYAETLSGIFYKGGSWRNNNHRQKFPKEEQEVVEEVFRVLAKVGDVGKALSDLKLTYTYRRNDTLRRENLSEEERQGRLDNLSRKSDILDTLDTGDFSVLKRNLYTVEIPDDTGRNYLGLDKRPTKTLIGKVLKYFSDNHPEFKVRIYGSRFYWERDGSTYNGGIEDGNQLYNTISNIFEYGDKDASLLLSAVGLKGITYPANHLNGGHSGGARNYVIFKEDDAKIVDRVEFMRTPQGTVYGWTVGGKIYLTESGMNAETPIHEYTHIWAHAMQQGNPEGWQSIKDLLRGTPVWDEVLSDPNYQHLADNEDAVASEALSRFSGREGRAKMEEMAQQTLDAAKGAIDKIEAGSVLARMREALNKFWRWVGKSLFDIKRFDSIEEVADRVLYDLVSVTDLNAGEIQQSAVPQMRIGNKRKAEMRKQLEKRRPDLVEQGRIEETIDAIEAFGEEEAGEEGDARLEKLALHWTMSSSIRLPEDGYAVRQAARIASAKKIDPMSYGNPKAIIDKFASEVKGERANPDTEPTFSNRKVIGDTGIVTYRVEDSREGQEAVRKMIDTHFGEDANPWCLAARTNGSMDIAWYYWNYVYNAYPKRIAFKDGKLLAFSANDKRSTLWWDRQDEPSKGIPSIRKLEGGRRQEVHYNTKGNPIFEGDIEEGNQENGVYRLWSADDTLIEEFTYKDGKRNGVSRWYYDNGQIQYEIEYKDDVQHGTRRDYTKEGRLEYEAEYKDGKRHGWTRVYLWNGRVSEDWYQNGKSIANRRYDSISGELIEETGEFPVDDDVIRFRMGNSSAS